MKNGPQDAGAKNKADRLSVIALSSLAERFFEDGYTVLHEIYGAEQRKNRDYQICHVQNCLQHGHGIAPLLIMSPKADKAGSSNQSHPREIYIFLSILQLFFESLRWR